MNDSFYQNWHSPRDVSLSEKNGATKSVLVRPTLSQKYFSGILKVKINNHHPYPYPYPNPYLATCNLARFLSCNLQLSKIPILQLATQLSPYIATQQSSYLATCNLARFLSCNLQLSNVYIFQLPTQIYPYLVTCNFALFFSWNLQKVACFVCCF